MRFSKPFRFVLLAMLLVGIAFGWAVSRENFSTTSYTCSRCRAVHRVTTRWGIESGEIEQSGYSRWYVQAHPSHMHHWCWSGSAKNYSAFTVGRACGHRHAVWEVHPEDQRRFVEGASPTELTKFYAYMDSPDQAEQKKGVAMVLRGAVGEVK